MDFRLNTNLRGLLMTIKEVNDEELLPSSEDYTEKE